MNEPAEDVVTIGRKEYNALVTAENAYARMRRAKKVILEALRREASDAGDNVARARHSFAGKNMAEQYGDSGETRGAILAAYEERSAEVQAAIDYAKTLPE